MRISRKVLAVTMEMPACSRRANRWESPETSWLVSRRRGSPTGPRSLDGLVNNLVQLFRRHATGPGLDPVQRLEPLLSLFPVSFGPLHGHQHYPRPLGPLDDHLLQRKGWAPWGRRVWQWRKDGAAGLRGVLDFERLYPRTHGAQFVDGDVHHSRFVFRSRSARVKASLKSNRNHSFLIDRALCLCPCSGPLQREYPSSRAFFVHGDEDTFLQLRGKSSQRGE